MILINVLGLKGLFDVHVKFCFDLRRKIIQPDKATLMVFNVRPRITNKSDTLSVEHFRNFSPQIDIKSN